MENVFYTKSPTLVKNVVLIDGLSRTGKFFLGKIVSGLENMEYFQSVNILGYIPFIHRVGSLTEDAAIELLRKTLDEHAYNMRIGRNLNQRYFDASSIFNSYERDEYWKRSFNIFGEVSLTADAIISSFHKDGRKSLFLVHETFPNIEIFFKAYPTIQVLHLVRHPIDVIYSWHKRGWGRRFGTDPLSITPVLKGKTQAVPWYACDWKEEYEKSSEIDRVIKSIMRLTKMSGEAYRDLTKLEKKQILFVRYEALVENSHKEIENIASFLNTKPSYGMGWILAREKCPKNIPLQQRKKKKSEIKRIASKESFDIMVELASRYENKKSLPYDKD